MCSGQADAWRRIPAADQPGPHGQHGHRAPVCWGSPEMRPGGLEKTLSSSGSKSHVSPPLDVMSHDLRAAAGLQGARAQPSGCHNVPSVSAALPGQSCGQVVRAPRGPDSAWSPCLATSGRVSLDTRTPAHPHGVTRKGPGCPHPAHQERRRKSC